MVTRNWFYLALSAGTISFAGCDGPTDAVPSKVPEPTFKAVAPSGSIPAEELAGSNGAKDINAAGDAVANYPTGVSCPSAVTPGVIALYHLDGTRVLLPLPSSGLYCTAAAYSINASGVVLGRLSGVGSVPSTLALWTPVDGGYTILELGATQDGYRPYTAGGFNAAGEVIGWTNVVANVPKLYWWSQATGWLAIPVPVGATLCQVYAGLNDRGEIVGKCTVGGVSNPYYWANHESAPIKMPTPSGVTDATPQDINNSGVVVGYSPALRWRPNGAGWIAEILPDAGRGASAYRIAEDGSVVGSLSTRNGGPLPAIWPQGGAYVLGAVSSGGWGEAAGVAVTAAGVVFVGGDRRAEKGLRWRLSSP